MNDITKKYTNEEITVIWKPSLCIHSKKCWTGLSSVFDPKTQPWVKIDGANSESITKQIDLCPSGALTYELKNKKMENSNSDNKIQISPNGPILVHGTIEITHADGKTEVKEKMTALCRCGASSNKPFCDGSHRKVDFKG